MKKLLRNYTFNKTAKTITFTGFSSINLQDIHLIVDTTNQTIIYNPFDPAKGGTVATNVLTLEFDTNTVDYNNSDALQIIFDPQDLIISGSVINNNTANLLIPVTEMSDYGYVAFHLQTIGTGTPTFMFEASNDNSIWINVMLQGGATGNGSTTATAANTIFHGPVPYRYFRVRVSVAGTGGSNATAILKLSQIPFSLAPISTVAATQSGSWTVSQSGTWSIAGSGTTSIAKAEDAAHANADLGVPSWGVRYESLTVPTSAAGDYSITQVDELGKTVNMPHAPSVNHLRATLAAITGTADTSLFAAAGASVRNYITSLTLANSSAIASVVELKDNTTVIWRGYLKANDTLHVVFPVPYRTTANTAMQIACVTTATNTYVSATGYIAP